MMKTKTLLILCLLLVGGIYSSSAGIRDTIWTNYHWDGYEISILGGDLYRNCTSFVRITADDPKEEINVSIDNGTIVKQSKNGYLITPSSTGYLEFKVNNASYMLLALNTPDPQVYLSAAKENWRNEKNHLLISKDDLYASEGIEVNNKFSNFEVQCFSITYNNKGDLTTKFSGGSKFTKEQREALNNLKNGQRLYVEDIQVKNADGSIQSVKPGTFVIIDNYKNEFIRQVAKYKPYTYDLGTIKTDLRIKIEGHPTEADRQTVSAFADTLSSILETIDVIMVDRQPNLTIIFDSVANDSLLRSQGFELINCGYLQRTPYLIFPFYFNYTMIITPEKYREAKEREIAVQQDLFNLLGNFADRAPGQSLLNGDSFSKYDRTLLKTLYSYRDGEYAVSKIIDEDFDYPDRTSLYIFILLWTLCLSFVLMEVYRYYGMHRIMSKIKIPIIVRVIESLLLAQVPALGFLVLIVPDGHWVDLGLIATMEKRFVPLYILWGIIFLGIDYLLNKIKKYGLKLAVNIALSFFGVILAYQIIYWFITPQYIAVSAMDWKLLVIPFILTFYRLIISFQQNKISGLLQEKELELSKQKELKFRSDLNALQARINPHFLYNSLNSIAALAHTDADRTEQMALSLSKLFRYNINKDNGMEASLEEEAEMAGVYLDVEKIRFGDRLSYTIALDEKLNSFRVPKFILQPLVENAVKHGTSQISTPGIIKIRIFESEGKVYIEVVDNGPAFPGGLMSGYGLQNTYEKLKLLYKKTFTIEFINQPEKMVKVTLSRQ